MKSKKMGVSKTIDNKGLLIAAIVFTIAFLIVFAVFTIQSSDESDAADNWWSYDESKKILTINRADGTIPTNGASEWKNYEINAINGYVKKIGKEAFLGCTGLTNVNLQDVTEVESNSFYNCTNLTSVSMQKLTKCGDKTFYNCTSLTDVSLPSLETAGISLFYNCTSLTDISLPSLKSVSTYTFGYCTNLISASLQNATYYSDNVFCNCTSLTTILLSNELKNTGTNTFSGCTSLRNISLPDGLEVIDKNTFYYCTNLTNVYIPNSVNKIGTDAFRNCTSLKNISLPKKLTTLDTSSFMNCGLTSVSLPEGLTEIGSSAFNSCSNITTVSLPKGMINIKFGAFNGCSKLVDITFPDGLKTIGDGAFKGCKLGKILVIPESVECVGAVAFEGCSAVQYLFFKPTIFSDDMVKYNAFPINNANRVVFTINETYPASFNGWANKGKTSLDPNNNLYGTYVKDGISNLIIVGNNTMQNYESGNNISSVIGDFNINCVEVYNVAAIGNYAFSEMTEISNVTLQDGVKNIGSHAFEGCAGLKQVMLNDKMTCIGDHAFEGCTELKKVTMLYGARSIGDYAFEGCKNLISITDYEEDGTSGITLCRTEDVGAAAFKGCIGIRTVSISNMKSCESDLFCDCINISSICISDGLEIVQDNMFAGCSNVSIYLPSTIKKISNTCDARSTGISIYLNSENPLIREIFPNWSNKLHAGTTIYLSEKAKSQGLSWGGGATINYLQGAPVTILVNGLFEPVFDNTYVLNGSKVILPFRYDNEMDQMLSFEVFGIAYDNNFDHLNTRCFSGDAISIHLNVNGSNNYHSSVQIREKGRVEDTNNLFVWHDNVYIKTDATEIKKELNVSHEPSLYSFSEPKTCDYGFTFTFNGIIMDGQTDLKYYSEYYGAYFDYSFGEFIVNEYIMPNSEKAAGSTFIISQQPKITTITWKCGIVTETEDIMSGSTISHPDPIPPNGKIFRCWIRMSTGEEINDWSDIKIGRNDETFTADFLTKTYHIIVKYNGKELLNQTVNGQYDLVANNDANTLSFKSSESSSYIALYYPAKYAGAFSEGKEFRYFTLGSDSPYVGEMNIFDDRTIVIKDKDKEFKVEFRYVDGDLGTTGEKNWHMINTFEGYRFNGEESPTFSKTYKIVDEDSPVNGLKMIEGGNYVLSISLPQSDYYICKDWSCNGSISNNTKLTIYLSTFKSSENYVFIDLNFYVGGFNIYFDYDDGTASEFWGSVEVNKNVYVPDTLGSHKKPGYVHNGAWTCAGNEIEISDLSFILTQKMIDDASQGLKTIKITIVWEPREYEIKYGIKTKINESDNCFWSATIPLDVKKSHSGAESLFKSEGLIPCDTIKIGQIDPFTPCITDLTLPGYKFNGVWYICDENWNHIGQFKMLTGFKLTATNAEEYVSGDYVYLMPCFEKLSYSVILDKNDMGNSIGSFKNITSSFHIGDTIELPTKTEMAKVMLGDKVFDHWSYEYRELTDNKFTITQNDVITNENNDSFIFYIVWVDMKYQISYNLNDGTGTTVPDSSIYKYGDTITLLDYSQYNKSGHMAIGWGFTESGLKENITEYNDRMVSYAAKGEDYTATLYLIWEPTSYNILYSLDGGSIDLSAPKKGFFDIETYITVPTKTGYMFAGWSPDSESDFDSDSARYWGGTKFLQWNITDTPLSDKFLNLCSESGKTVILKANWVAASYKLVFNSNGGNSINQINNLTTSLDDIDLTLPIMTGSKKGFNFIGWSLDKENLITSKGFSREMVDAADSSNTVILYAMWSPFNYKVIFDDGVGNNRTIDALYGIKVDIGTPERIGYVFSGWKGTVGTNAQYSNDSTYWYGYTNGTTIQATMFKNLSDVANSTITMRAEWTPAIYSIAYSANGAMGEAPVDSTKYIVGKEINMMEPSYKFKQSNGNKIFLGWSYDPKSTIPLTLTEFTENLATYSDMFNRINLYAIWVSGSYRATVDLGDATASEIPAGWKLDNNGYYFKEVGEGSSMKDIMSEWENVTLSMDGKIFKSWNYESSTVMTDVKVMPVFEEVNNVYLIIFFASIILITIATFLLVRFERRF